MPRFRDQAICIRHFDWSETSQVVSLLTEHHGKLRGVAKGARRTSPSSVQRYSGGIELLTLGQAVGTTKPSAELASITEWDLQQPYWHLRRDLAAQRLALYAADITNALLAERDPHPVVFHALCQLLAQLTAAAHRERSLLRYQWRLLTDCGYQPELIRDVRSNLPLVEAPSYTFDAAAGGLTAAVTDDRTAWQVRSRTVQLLRRLSGTDSSEEQDDPLASADEPTLGRANRLLCVYIRAILDRELMTMSYVLEPAGR